jgi:hypothetical protein
MHIETRNTIGLRPRRFFQSNLSLFVWISFYLTDGISAMSGVYLPFPSHHLYFINLFLLIPFLFYLLSCFSFSFLPYLHCLL